MLVKSNFFFSHNVFDPIWYLFSILNALLNFVCNCSHLDQSNILSSGGGFKDKYHDMNHI